MRRLSLNEFSFLSAMLDLGPVRWSILIDHAGFDEAHARWISRGLVAYGLIDHPGYNWWGLSERGKIVLAIETGRFHRRQLRMRAA